LLVKVAGRDAVLLKNLEMNFKIEEDYL